MQRRRGKQEAGLISSRARLEFLEEEGTNVGRCCWLWANKSYFGVGARRVGGSMGKTCTEESFHDIRKTFSGRGKGKGRAIFSFLYLGRVDTVARLHLCL